ncbi:hypothetical protein AB0D47_20650 [Streptomyces sp. NPDC048376]|uniref:hypothetical protein n=1 Tax=Streptomyces sp. NPDC048376 TaxID=3154926 RepID=UPI003429CC50
MGFTKRQKLARKPILQALAQLDEAVRLRDWRRARLARTAAWTEVEKLADDLTREERKRLWKYKHQILAGEAQDRRRRERT